MNIRTIDGSQTDLAQDALNNFKLRLRGPVLLPGDTGYDEARSLWNGMIDRKPAMIVRCLGTADIIASVQFAREHNLLLSIKGGGHNIGGLATADGALMLDMSLMRGVWVDAQKRIAHAQPGCLLGDVDRETQLHGLAAVLGFVSQTGIAGLTLGGGFGYLTRRWGWTADNVVAMDVVTADAELVRASADENPDLFWGLRGGGGNFGVVTGFEYKLYPVGPEIVGGIVAWPASEAPKVLEFYRSMAESAPEELTLVAFMRPAPPAPWLPKEMHGKLIVAMLACYSGDPAQGEKVVAPIKSFGQPIGDVLVRRPYVQLQALLDATQPKGRRYYWKSEYLAQIDPALCEQVMQHAARIQSPHSNVILFQLGGALNRRDDRYSAAGNRAARYVVNITASWEQPEQDGANIEWARNAWQDMKAFSTGGTYINFLTADEGPERTEAALGEAMQQLGAIKAKWDPDNAFRVNRNIQPARAFEAVV
jgi:FAD/FMN-containing dehydrogenase